MEIKIEKLINEGFGLGRTESGKPVFVRKSVPGDELDIEISKDKKSYSEAVIKKIIKPSPQRIEPVCPYFNECGGCEHQNISYQNQLKYKEEIFRETLLRQGIKIKIEPVIAGSNSPFYYRNSIRFEVIHNKDKSVSFARHNQIFDKGYIKVKKCLLQSKTCNKILSVLLDALDKNNDSKKSLWQIKIREGKFTGEFMVELITTSYELPMRKEIVEVLTTIKEIKSIYHTIAPAKSLRNLKRKLLFGSPIIHEKIGKYSFQISPESFFQTNSLGIHTLYDKIKEFAQIKMGDSVLDLFCGTGTIGIYLSTLAKAVTGIEIVPEAIRDATDNAKINKINNIDFLCLNAEKYFDQLKTKNKQLTTIIVDPPRAGLTKDIIDKILDSRFKILVYVSCNPATFARDVKVFEENNIVLKKVQPIDMFPQTHHIECVGLLEKKSA